MQFAALQWMWFRSIVKRHRRVLGLLLLLILALAALARPHGVDEVRFRDWTGWLLALVLGVITWRQYVTAARRDSESEFSGKVIAIVRPTEIRELLQSMDARMCEGFESTNLRLIDLGERVSCIEGRLKERRRGPSDRRSGPDERRTAEEDE